MNTQQLETFIQVAENLNFARAAQALSITQSAVSRQIHSLEVELDTKLLHRTTRTVVLTPAGLSFLDDARQILNRLNLAKAKIQHNEEAYMQVLFIGCGSEAQLDVLPRILDICRREIPAFHPILRVISHRSLLNLFYQGEIDVLLGFQDDIPFKDDTSFLKLLELPVCCALPSSHPYAQKAWLDEKDLLSEKMISCNSYAIPEKAIEIQNRISKYLPPGSVYLCGNLQAALTLIRAGYGYCILPKASFADERIRYVPLRNFKPLSYGIFYKKGAVRPLLGKFLSIARRSLEE